MLSPIRTHSRVQGAQHQAISIRFQAFKNSALFVRNVVESGQAGLGLETLIADMAACCLNRLLSQISIHDLTFRTIRQPGHKIHPPYPAFSHLPPSSCRQ